MSVVSDEGHMSTVGHVTTCPQLRQICCPSVAFHYALGGPTDQ